MNQQALHSKVTELCLVHGGKGIGKVRANIGLVDYDPLGEKEADCSYRIYSASYQLKGNSEWQSTKEFEDPEEVFAQLTEMLEWDFPQQEEAKEVPIITGNKAFNNFYSTLRKTG